MDRRRLWNPGHLITIVLMIFMVISYFFRLDQPSLWSDEAETAVISHNILKTGLPMGFDGRNFIISSHCDALAKNFLMNRIPWIHYYVGALSQALLGSTTFGARFLFAFVGLLCFFPIYHLLKSRTNYPLILTTLLLLSPQVIMFQRNARYYSVTTLFFCCLLWFHSRDRKIDRNYYLLGGLLWFSLYHSQTLVGFCTSAAFLIAAYLCSRKQFWPIFAMSGVCLASWALWYFSLPSISLKTHSILGLLRTSPDAYFQIFLSGITSALYDMDFSNVLPLFVVGGILAILINRGAWRETLNILQNEFLYLATGLSLVIQIIGIAVLVGSETEHGFSYMRYHQHLFPALGVLLFFLCQKVMPNERKALGAFVVISVLNISPLGYWGSGRYITYQWKPTWWIAVYNEIYSEYHSNIMQLVDVIKQYQKDKAQTDPSILTIPPWVARELTFYLGDKFIVQYRDDATDECGDAMRQIAGNTLFQRTIEEPDHIFLFSNRVPNFAGYESISLPAQTTSISGTRPDLHQHRFKLDASNQYRLTWFRKVGPQTAKP